MGELMIDTTHRHSGSSSGESGRGFSVLIASRDEAALGLLKEIVFQIPDIKIQTRLINNGHSDPLYGMEQLPDLLVFRLGTNWEIELEELSARPAATRPPVLIVSEDLDPAVMRSAMQAGARDFFVEPVAGDDLVRSVQSLHMESFDAATRGSGKVTAVINAKGGSGASLIACNLAHMLVAHCQDNVALMDLDLQFGSLCHYLDLNIKHGIKEALENIDSLDAVALNGYMARHQSGLKVIGATADELMLTEEVQSDQLLRLIELMCEQHDHLILDLPRQIDLVTSTALEVADKIIIVVQQNITNVRDGSRLMEILREELEIDNDKVMVVLNRYEEDALITTAEIEKAMKHEITLKIPNDFKHVSESINDGVPLYRMARKAPSAQAILSLSELLDGGTIEVKKGVLGRFIANITGR